MRTDWIEVELGTILVQSKEKHTPKEEQELFYVGLEHIEKELGTLTDSNRIEKINTLKNRFEPGQILYGKLRPYLNKVYLAKESGVCSTDILVFQPSDVVFPKFAHLYMLSRKFVNHMSENTSGVNLPRVSTSYINSYPFPIPPLPEQRAIVARIEELFSELDHAVSSLQSAQAKLDIYRQAVLKKAFEGGFTSNPFGETELPENWRRLRLGEILKVTSGKGLTSSQMDGGKFPVYGGNGINGNHSEFLYDEPKLIIGRVGVRCGVTHITLTNSWVTDNALVVEFKKGEDQNLKFMKLKLEFENLNKLSNSTAQPVISGSKIYDYVINLPNFSEQLQIVQEIESRLSVADKLAETIQTNLQKSEALRQSILKKAFEGRLLSEAEVEACRREADWESAERLLERINQSSKSKKVELKPNR